MKQRHQSQKEATSCNVSKKPHCLSPLRMSLVVVLLLSLLSFHKVFAANDNVDSSSLFDAARNDDPNGIQKALEAGANINAKGPGGQTPLIFATLSGRFQSAKYLMEISQQYNLDVTLTEKDGYNVLHAAGFQGRNDILEMLLQYDSIKEMVMKPHKDGYYPIHRACWGREVRHTETLRVFVEQAGVDPILPAGNGKICAEMTRNPTTLQYLQEYSLSTTSSSSSTETETETASESGSDEL